MPSLFSLNVNEPCHMVSLNRGLTVLDACSHIGETEGELPQLDAMEMKHEAQ